MNKLITIDTIIKSNIEKVWEYWTNPDHIINWNFASDDWHCPHAENNLVGGGKFSWRMEAKDGSMGFDFSGTYDRIEPLKLIELTLDDNRTVSISFTEENESTKVTESFEPDKNDIELQRQGWQAILNNFKKYVETDIVRSKKEIAIAFSNGNFELTYPYLSEDIKWIIVGENSFTGKDEVIENCDQTKEYFRSVQTDFNTEEVIAVANNVVVRGTGEFFKDGKRINFITACDVYKFDAENKLLEIFSYCIPEKK